MGLDIRFYGGEIFEDDDQRSLWNLDHSSEHHLFFTSAIAQGFGITQFFPIDTFDLKDPDALFTHYKMHLSLDQAIGIGTTPDLASVPLTTRALVDDWLLTHSNQHSLERSALGL